MCLFCFTTPSSAQAMPRRAFVQGLTIGAVAVGVPAAQAQVDVGKSSAFRKLIPAETLENSAGQQYQSMLQQAQKKREYLPANHPQVQQVRAIAQRLIPFAASWNPRASLWRWEVNVIQSPQVNAFCMPGGKIAVYTGILDQLHLTPDEIAIVMGHEMAHALREHSREQLGKSKATSVGLSLGARLLGLGDLGDVAANLGTQLLSLKYSRDDESDADLVGLELAARAGFNPQSSVVLWQKMTQAHESQGLNFLSTHPSGPERIRTLQANVPKVQGLYDQAVAGNKG